MLFRSRLGHALLNIRATDRAYQTSMENAMLLAEGCLGLGPNGYKMTDKLYDFELEVIKQEGLQHYFKAYNIVSCHCSDTSFGANTLPVARATRATPVHQEARRPLGGSNLQG